MSDSPFDLFKALPLSAEDALRVRIAAKVDAAPELLSTLARDPSVSVRATVAMNDAAPPEALDLLAIDGDERIRAVLAHKLANVLPSLTGHARERMYDDVAATLTRLVADEAARVRAVIAETLKEMPNVPRELILRLARDREPAVSEPILRLSPLLTVADLLGLLAKPASPITAMAIARRPALQDAVCDAIAVSNDSQAIRTLLENKSAAIREETLDALIARAGPHDQWHEPLVHRPKLSGRAASALARIVATHLLGVLTERADLDDDIRRDLRRRLEERLAGQTQAGEDNMTLDRAMAEARVMFEENQLTEPALLEAAGRGAHVLATAMLAVAADVPASLVERATSLRTAKGVVSLVWKAGFSMRAAVTLQSLLAQISPAAILRPSGKGGFPLGADEMRWQLDFLAKTTR